MRISYGSDPAQFGDLYLPAESGAWALPVVVLVHGGYWHAEYGLDLMAPLAEDLITYGVAAWNVEYRRIENGGGWPATFADAAAALDAVTGVVQDGSAGALNTDDIRVLGHSAGGQLAVWLAGRHTLPDGVVGSAPQVPVRRVVSLAGVLDLLAAERDRLNNNSAGQLMGVSSAEDRQRYELASPQQRVPIGVPVTCVHGDADTNVPFSQSADYVSAATRAGDSAELITVPGADHFALIDPSTPAWAQSRAALLTP